MKKALLILIIVTGIAVLWFLLSKENNHRGPVNTITRDRFYAA
jgi:hypothetical protein